MWFLVLALLFLHAITATTATPTDFKIDINDTSLSMIVNGNEWLTSALVPNIHGHSSLTQQGKAVTTGGSDALGAFTSTSWEWAADGMEGGSTEECPDGVIMTTSVRVYANRAAFSQSFPCGLNFTSNAKTSWLVSDFPTFHVGKTAKFDKCALFNKPFLRESIAANVRNSDGIIDFYACTIGVQGGVPVVLYEVDSMNDTTSVGSSLTFSQLDHFKTGEMYLGSKGDAAHFSIGLKGTLTSVPAGFSLEWVVSYSPKLMRNALERWGDTLLAKSGKTRWGPYDDTTASYMGYWTDNGAYYHYGGVNATPGAYATAMIETHKKHIQARLPFKHWQLDSWWYPKGHGGSQSSQTRKGNEGGTYRWEADPFVFPEGIASVQKAIELPFIQHNRWYSPWNWYKNSSTFNSQWVGDDFAILPLDLDNFWAFFFEQVDDYGAALAVYEQDFLYTQYDHISEMKTNATFADDWLSSLASHAARKNLTIQFCMPYPREYLVSTAHQNVVSIRASGDYHAGRNQWQISRASLLAHAVGVLPFKDTFNTNNNAETNGADTSAEPNAELETIVATLSASIVGPGDGPGLINRTRLMRCCSEDGLVLKADRPAIPIDSQWTGSGPGGEVSFAPATAGGRTNTYVLAAALGNSYNLTPADLELDGTKMFIAYNWFTGESQEFTAKSPIKLIPRHQIHRVSYEFWVVAPLIDGFAVLGDLTKYIGASSRRVKSITSDGISAEIIAFGPPKDTVSMAIYTPKAAIKRTTLNIGASGSVKFTFDIRS